MTKYKICKFVNGNGKEWYQIQKRGWIFWHYLSGYQYVGGPIDFPPLKTILQFESVEKTQEYIDTMQKTTNYVNKNKIVKKVECFDYGS